VTGGAGPLDAGPLDDGPLDDGPLDDGDAAILEELRGVYTAADPVPADLLDRVTFALALEDIDLEVLRMREESTPLLSAVRGEERSRTITFDSDSLTIMISLSPSDADDIRIDGWLAPPAAHRVELRTATGALVAIADDDGRFVIEPVPRGIAQLVVRTGDAESQGNGRTVVTPSIVV